MGRVTHFSDLYYQVMHCILILFFPIIKQLFFLYRVQVAIKESARSLLEDTTANESVLAVCERAVSVHSDDIVCCVNGVLMLCLL